MCGSFGVGAGLLRFILCLASRLGRYLGAVISTLSRVTGIFSLLLGLLGTILRRPCRSLAFSCRMRGSFGVGAGLLRFILCLASRLGRYLGAVISALSGVTRIFSMYFSMVED